MIWLVVVLTAGCAGHLPPRQLALNSASRSNKALALAQDLEAQVCWAEPSAPAAKLAGKDLTKCSTDVAEKFGLNAERHQNINRVLAQLFEKHLKMTQDLRLWTKGLPIPVSVQEFVDSSSRLQTLLHELATGHPKIQALLDQAQALIQAGERILKALQEAR